MLGQGSSLIKEEKRYWNNYLCEDVEIREPNNFGYCVNCGSINRYPERLDTITICVDCKRTRLTDARKMDFCYKKWFGEKK